jgi:hypothetical protein
MRPVFTFRLPDPGESIVYLRVLALHPDGFSAPELISVMVR